MKKFLRKNKKYFGLILIAAIVFNFAFLPLTAKAAEGVIAKVFSWISADSLLFISDTVSVILGALFGLVLYLEALIIDYILSPNNFSFTNATVVTLGWGITRDLANMFFIFILLIIAFATVLKIQSYAIKQLWWKVLVAAILINFSLVIAGFVIDFTQVLTTFFIKQAIGNDFISITTKLANSMKITNFYNPALPTSVSRGVLQFGASAIAATVGIILTLVGLVVTVFVFGATAVFLIVRILYIWFLLIIAPIVWILWIMPATSKYFSQWWDKFIQWAFFAPIYVFMIYLSLSIFTETGELGNSVFFGTTPPGWNTAAAGLTTTSLPSAIFQWILVIAMMFGSLIVAQKFGVEGATGARKILTGWGTDTKNWAGRYARRKTTGWTQPLTEAEKAVPPPQGIRGKIGAAWRKTGAAIGGAAVAIPGVRLGYQKMLAGQQKTYQDSYNKYKNIDPAILKQTLESAIFLKPEDKMAVQSLLIEKGKLKPDAPELIEILNRAKNYGQESTLLASAMREIDPIILKQALESGLSLRPENKVALQSLLIEKGKLKPEGPELIEIFKKATYGQESILLASVIKEMDDAMLPEKGFTGAIRTDLIERAKKHNLDKPFRKFFPVLAPEVLKKGASEEQIKEYRENEMKKIDNLADIYLDQLTSEVVNLIPTEKLRDFFRRAAKDKKDKVRDEINKKFKEFANLKQSEGEYTYSDRQGKPQKTTYNKMLSIIASETHRDTRNRMLNDFINKYADEFTFKNDQEKEEWKEKTADAIRRQFIAGAQVWDTG